MRAVVTRVASAKVTVAGEITGQIGRGYLVLLGVGPEDTPETAKKLADKICNLRIFEDENGKMNLGLSDIGGEILLISQFTLLADCSHGNRPSFIGAEKPERAKALYELAAEKLRALGLTVKMGVFGADMKIEQYNDGPVTIILDSPAKD